MGFLSFSAHPVPSFSRQTKKILEIRSLFDKDKRDHIEG